MKSYSILLYIATSAFSLSNHSASVANSLNGDPSINVSVDDLDLTSPHDQKVLDTRIRAAARRLCGKGTISTGALPNRCLVDSVRGAQRKRDQLVERRIAAKAYVSQSAHVPRESAAGCVQDGEQKPGDYDACGDVMDSPSNRRTPDTREDEAPTDETTLNTLKGW
jgi:UrcA family protein